MNGNRNDLTGNVLAYEPIHGAGAAVVTLDPESSGTGDKEYDEDDVEFYGGDRNVLDTNKSTETENSPAEVNSGPKLFDPVEGENTVNTSKAQNRWVPIHAKERRRPDLLVRSWTEATRR